MSGVSSGRTCSFPCPSSAAQAAERRNLVDDKDCLRPREGGSHKFLSSKLPAIFLHVSNPGRKIVISGPYEPIRDVLKPRSDRASEGTVRKVFAIISSSRRSSIALNDSFDASNKRRTTAAAQAPASRLEAAWTATLDLNRSCQPLGCGGGRGRRRRAMNLPMELPLVAGCCCIQAGQSHRSRPAAGAQRGHRGGDQAGRQLHEPPPRHRSRPVPVFSAIAQAVSCSFVRRRPVMSAC